MRKGERWRMRKGEVEREVSLIRSKRMMKGENIWEMKRSRRIKKNMWEDEKKSDGDKKR